MTQVVISPDGKLVAASSLDGTIWLWRVSDGRLMYVFQGHTAGVLSMAVSPTGTLLAPYHPLGHSLRPDQVMEQ
ncbi:MAG: hypothetical protein AMJ88_17480 [Anaerolineae bacterium SM23_ 63]|nr:MAG: hypothetical protein AMJ88_17480 [Anaerolineae bacterium SM23_ 63]